MSESLPLNPNCTIQTRHLLADDEALDAIRDQPTSNVSQLHDDDDEVEFN